MHYLNTPNTFCLQYYEFKTKLIVNFEMQSMKFERIYLVSNSPIFIAKSSRPSCYYAERGNSKCFLRGWSREEGENDRCIVHIN